MWDGDGRMGANAPGAGTGGAGTAAGHDVEVSELGPLGGLLGVGGQARVYDLPLLRLPDVPSAVVYKEFKPGHAPPAGVRGVVTLRLALDDARRARLDAVAAWPARTVTGDGEVRGLLLPRIPDSFFADLALPSGATARKAREIQYLFVQPDRVERLGLELPTVEQRLAVCRDAAAALAFLHDELDAVFGDVNAKNVLYRTDAPPGEPAAMLVDCDAVRVRGSAGSVQQLNAPDWDPPEGGRALTVETDRYKLGLLVLRCLTPGEFRSLNRDPATAAEVLDAAGLDLLERALSDNPGTRPSATQWQRHLSVLLGETVDPPVLRSAEVDRTFVTPGDTVTVRWSADAAASVEVWAPGAAPVTVDGGAGSGQVAVIPARTGTVRVLARNAVGSDEATTRAVAVMEMPSLVAIPVPMPEIPLQPPSPAELPGIAAVIPPLPALHLPTFVPAPQPLPTAPDLPGPPGSPPATAAGPTLPPSPPFDLVELMTGGPSPADAGPSRGGPVR